MLKNYKNDLIIIATFFALISYSMYILAAGQTIINVAAAVEQAKKPAAPVKKTEPVKKVDKAAAKPAEPKKDPNRKKPTLKKKYKK